MSKILSTKSKIIPSIIKAETPETAHIDWAPVTWQRLSCLSGFSSFNQNHKPQTDKLLVFQFTHKGTEAERGSVTSLACPHWEWGTWDLHMDSLVFESLLRMFTGSLPWAFAEGQEKTQLTGREETQIVKRRPASIREGANDTGKRA